MKQIQVKTAFGSSYREVWEMKDWLILAEFILEKVNPSRIRETRRQAENSLDIRWETSCPTQIYPSIFSSETREKLDGKLVLDRKLP